MTNICRRSGVGKHLEEKMVENPERNNYNGYTGNGIYAAGNADLSLREIFFSSSFLGQSWSTVR